MTETHNGHQHAGIDEDDGLSYYARRARSIEALLVAKNICSTEEVQRVVDQADNRSPADGARVVARAWVDTKFKALLLAEPKSALAELGFALADTATQLEVIENTDQIHHMVVCTLCSCYPRTLLGRPPDWYKSLAYRSRAVVDPRGVMREFGLELDDKVTVRVLDSTADMRYLVLPRRPAGSEGMNEEQLAKLVTRDSMVGVTDALSPASVASSI